MIDDDEQICTCGLCLTVNVIFSFASNNYTKFIISSSILQLAFGYYYCNSMVYVIGYINLIYMLRQLNYKILVKILTCVLIPIYFYTQSCTNYNTSLFLSALLDICLIFQLIGAGIKTFVYYNQLISNK